MPLFDFRCETCQHQFEVLVRSGDELPNECPACGQAKVKKMVTAPAFSFKGEGWYKDLYGKPAPKSEKSDSATTTPNNTAKTETSETKPAEPATS